MHSSSVLNLERFFKIYLKKFNNPTILDYGGASHDNKTTALTVLENSLSSLLGSISILFALPPSPNYHLRSLSGLFTVFHFFLVVVVVILIHMLHPPLLHRLSFIIMLLSVLFKCLVMLFLLCLSPL